MLAITCVLLIGLQNGKPAGLVDRLYADLKNTRAANLGYERYIRSANILLDAAVKDREYSEVAKSFAAQGIKEEEPESSDSMTHTFRPASLGFKLSNGKPVALELSLTTLLEMSETSATKIKVVDPSASLVVDLDLPTAELPAPGLFPRGSVVEALLHRPAFIAAAKKYAKVKSLTVGYDFEKLYPSYVLEMPDWLTHVFEIIVELEKPVERGTGYARFAYQAESYLDPLMSYDETRKKERDTPVSGIFGQPESLHGNANREDEPFSSSEHWTHSGSEDLMIVANTWSYKPPIPPAVPRAYSPGDLLTADTRISALQLDPLHYKWSHVDQLGRLVHLESLFVPFNTNVNKPTTTSSDWQVLGKLQSLQELHLWDDVDEQIMPILAKLPLKKLRLGTAQLNDSFIRDLATSKTLEELVLGSSSARNPLTDKSLGFFAQMPRLHKLELYCGGQFSSAGFQQLAAVRGMRSLFIPPLKQNGDDDLQFLSRFKELEELSLRGVTVGPKTMHAISTLGKLKNLSFYNVKGVDDNSIAELASLKHIEFLRFSECPGVTANAVKALRSQLHGDFVDPDEG